MGHRNPDPARRCPRAELVRLPDLQTYRWYEYTGSLVDGDFLAGTADRRFYRRPLIWGDRKMSGEAQAATEVRQATFCNIEDNFNRIRARCQQETAVLMAIIDGLAGGEPPSLDPSNKNPIDRAEKPARDDIPYIQRVEVAATDAFDSLQRLENQVARLSNLALV